MCWSVYQCFERVITSIRLCVQLNCSNLVQAAANAFENLTYIHIDSISDINIILSKLYRENWVTSYYKVVNLIFMEKLCWRLKCKLNVWKVYGHFSYIFNAEIQTAELYVHKKLVQLMEYFHNFKRFADCPFNKNFEQNGCKF